MQRSMFIATTLIVGTAAFLFWQQLQAERELTATLRDRGSLAAKRPQWVLATEPAPGAEEKFDAGGH